MSDNQNHDLRKIVHFIILWLLANGLKDYGTFAQTSLVDSNELILFKTPAIHVWSQTSTQFDPYRQITKKDRTFSEYVIINRLRDEIDISLILYDDADNPSIPANLTDAEKQSFTLEVLERQNLAKEYYWTFLNASGVLPCITFINTTIEDEADLSTEPDDFIRFRSRSIRKFVNAEQAFPPFDILIEVPANTRSFQSKRVILETYTWGLLRWRLSYDVKVTWEEIRQDPAPAGSRTWLPEPEQFVVLNNPCIPDLFMFSIITQSPMTGVNRVYTIVPMLEQTHWSNVTSGFCVHTDNNDPECGSVSQIILTNNHLLGLSNLGLFVSNPLNGSEFVLALPPEVLPVAVFRLLDPCSEIPEIHCFDSSGDQKPGLVYSIKLHYTPVCYLYQKPNYKDVVIMTIEHAIVGVPISENISMGGNNTGPRRTLTILYASEPYTTWNVLIKDLDTYKDHPIIRLTGIFYNHQLYQFDMVLGYAFTGSKVPQYVRIILPEPADAETFFTHERFDMIEDTVFEFPRGFVVSNIQVFPISMDVFFLGNQLYISESGGQLVYNAVSNFAASDDLVYCGFNHADRAFVCVNQGHTIILVGYVGSNYGMRETYAAEITEIKRLCEEERWTAPYPPGNSNTTNDTIVRGLYDKLNAPRYGEAFRHFHYAMGFSGTIQMWYLEGHEIVVRNNNTELPGARMTLRPGDLTGSTIPALEAEYHAQLQRPPNPKPASINLLNISPLNIPFVSELTHGPMVPFPSDAFSVFLYEATVDLSTNNTNTSFRYLSQVNIANNIRCANKNATPEEAGRPSTQFNCEVFIRHIKSLRTLLPGFRTVILGYNEFTIIPMIAFECEFKMIVQTASNAVMFEHIVQQNRSVCECWQHEQIGWTVYVPGHFSVLLQRSGQYVSTDPNTPDPPANRCAIGIATRRANDIEEIVVRRHEAYLIDMSTTEYKRARDSIDLADNLTSVSRSNASDSTDPSWVLEGGECLHSLAMVDNSVIRNFGGHIILDLRDSLSFAAQLTAESPKGRVQLQRPLIVLSNSNPRLLHVEQEYKRFPRFQRLEVFVRPSGFGVGVTTLMVRTQGCSSKCTNPCSLTFVFQLMHQEGRSLVVQYPFTEVGTEEHTAEEAVVEGFVPYPRIRGIIFQRNDLGHLHDYENIPVNYRPPSARGLSIPLSRNVYNVDPAATKFNDFYRITKETGVYKKCLHKENREQCGCTEEDKWNDDPLYSDCKEKAFLVRRAREVVMRLTYPPLMDAAQQNAKFFQERPRLTVKVEEVNGRTEYSITSGQNQYLHAINSDKILNHGFRYFLADDLHIVCFGTGLFHFKASLGEYDSFGDVSGHFMFFSEEFGIHDVTYMIVMFCALSVCFLLLFCGFVRVRKRLTSHLPLHGETDQIEVEA